MIMYYDLGVKNLLLKINHKVILKNNHKNNYKLIIFKFQCHQAQLIIIQGIKDKLLFKYF